jgi:hypothetical protein
MLVVLGVSKKVLSLAVLSPTIRVDNALAASSFARREEFGQRRSKYFGVRFCRSTPKLGDVHSFSPVPLGFPVGQRVADRTLPAFGLLQQHPKCTGVEVAELFELPANFG